MEERPNRPAPIRMGDVVNQLMARRGYARILSQSQYEDVWHDMVGEAISQRTRVGNLKRSILEVTVENSVLVQELSFRKSELIAKLRNQFPDHPIADIRFRVAPIR